MTTFKNIFRIITFPVLLLFNPKTAKLYFDRWINRYDNKIFDSSNSKVPLFSLYVEVVR